MRIYPFLFFLFLTSCAGPRITDMDVELERHRMAAVIECYKAKSLARPAFEDARDYALVAMAEALANQAGKDGCAAIAGMNAHEARAKIAEAQNASVANITSALTKGATTIAGIVVGGSVVKEGFKSVGTKTTITGEGNIGRDDVSTQVTQTVDNSTTGGGE